VALELEATGPLPAVSNRELFGSAVGNLVSNAVLYSEPRGRVKVVARRAGGRVEVEVADNGCGIAPEHLPHLFDRFYRVESSRSGTDGGFGLGLTIARRIAELHGGTLELTSQVGVGTRALLSLPAQLEGGGAVAAGDPAPPVAGGPG
jgi:signal transduction histidine kinase